MIPGTRLQRIAAVVLVTAATLALIGAVVLTTTPLGCGPANSLGIKVASARCQTVASVQSPSPYLPSNPLASVPSPAPTTNPYPQPVSANPYPQPASYIPFQSGSSAGFYPGSGNTIPGYPLNCRLPIYSGIWLSAGNGTALDVAGQGWYWMSGIGGRLAGGCN